MGFTGLARWINAPTNGLDRISENIIRNHHGIPHGRWLLSVRSFRSSIGTIPGIQIPSERSMCTLTMNDTVFVLLEDPSAPTRAEVLTNAAANPSSTNAINGLQNPSHYRSAFLTLRPPGALEQLLTQLKARWVPVRQTAPNSQQRNQAVGGPQLLIDGYIFAIGNDWLVRVGNVSLPGGGLKGMLLEAEYLPLPVLPTNDKDGSDGTSELVSNLLTSVLPNIRDAKIVAVTVSDSQWDEVFCDPEEEERSDLEKEKEKEKEREKAQSETEEIYVYGEEAMPVKQRGDWVGVERDRRSAFLIVGALKSEGIL